MPHIPRTTATRSGVSIAVSALHKLCASRDCAMKFKRVVEFSNDPGDFSSFNARVMIPKTVAEAVTLVKQFHKLAVVNGKYSLDDETSGPATGIPYDEMENLIQVMQQSGSSQEAELSAVSTIQQMEQTELFQLMVSQIAGGKERVAEMLDKYNANSIETNAINAESSTDDFQQFKINNFL